MLVGGAFVSINGDALVDDVAVEVVLFAQRLHDELLEIFGKEDERVLVGEDDHVLFALAVSGAVPRDGELHGGILSGVLLARLPVHGGCTGEELVDVEPLQRGGDETDGGEHGSAAADPVFHREAGDEVLLGGVLIELGTHTGDGGGVAAEIESGGFIGGFRLQHAVAGLGGAAGFGNDEDEGAVQADDGELGDDGIHPGGVGVVEEVEGKPRVLADGFGNELRAERGTADADEQDLFEMATGWRGDGAGVDFFREALQVVDGIGDGAAQFLGRGEGGIAQPVVADHAAFIGVGDGTGFDGFHVGEGLGDLWLERGDVGGLDVHQGEIEGKSVLRIADETLVVGLPGHGGIGLEMMDDPGGIL